MQAVDPSHQLATRRASWHPVRERASKAGYSRDQFGPAWDDVGGNKCNTRDDILRRDLTNVRSKVRTHTAHRHQWHSG